MTRTRTLASFALSLSLVLAACGGKEKDKEGGGKTGGGGGGGGKAPAAMTMTKLSPLPLQGDAPAGAQVLDSSVDAPAVMVSGDGCAYKVSTVTEAYASTFDAEKSELQKLTDGFKAFSKEEQFEGGWHFEYEGVDPFEKKPMYGVEIRQTIGGKQYACGRNDGNKALIDCAAKACRSLKPA